ncbi:MAG: hypothetical protein BTN85_1387 [Candidatus Methanohalarchaeum thermophilum]|uniref:DUF5611 domain-containing protein n=1 Tax=Methanohalarchaeum thermophilum TaxID=1903181 RepID=A0A1Q6DWZ7_METT1|nr:MAG: hypothetical protein BTN85_1387 [Candidatus Methanohalarchaeum thermophilum]
MKGRKFKAKRGHYIKKDEVEEAIKDIFEEYEKNDNLFKVRNYLSFELLEIEVLEHKNKKNRLRVYTEADLSKSDKALDSKRDLNKFLKKITGYTAKERMKRMKKEVED